jgi:general stress protein 26
MNEQEMKDASLVLMSEADAVYLTTIDEQGFPQTRAMLNLRNKEYYPGLVAVFREHDKDYLLYFTTNTSSEKILQIKKNPAVCVYFCKPKEFHGFMLSGEIEIIEDPRTRQMLWQEGWERYYPQGPNDPDHTVLRLLPQMAKGWYRAQTFAFVLKK